MSVKELFDEIVDANPSNEAEVETKILLNIFKLLGFNYQDRADKIKVKMNFGREQKTKIADFILYNGTDRTVNNSLIAVETKKTTESISGAEGQAISYSAWAGTPYFMVCNGIEIMVAKHTAFSTEVEKVSIRIDEIHSKFNVIYDFSNKTEVILNKERLAYITKYFPKIENLPPVDFFREYLDKFKTRFSYHGNFSEPLTGDNRVPIDLPVSINLNEKNYMPQLLTEDIINSEMFVVIEGEPGSGKSTLCNKLAYLLSEKIVSENINTVPIFVSLRTSIPKDIFTAFKYSCDELGVSVFENIYRDKINNISPILILDGFDEVSDLENGSKNLGRLINDSNIHSLVITSRPHTINELNIISHNLRFATINKLTKSEISNIAERFKIDVNYLENISGLDISSPIQLLMIIKLYNEGYLEKHFSLFELYRKYIVILTKYYNKECDENYIDKLLNTLGEVANLVVKYEHLGEKISLSKLYNMIQKPAYFGDLIKCGLVTSKSGNASFLHKTFEEYGIAYILLECVNNLDEQKIKSVSISSDEVYRVIASNISDSNKQNLFILLKSKSNKVRKRAIGILKYIGLSEADEYKLIETLKVESSQKVKRTIFRMLAYTKKGDILINLLQYKGISRTDKKDYFKVSYNSDALKEAISIISLGFEKFYNLKISYWVLFYALHDGALYKFNFELLELIINDDAFEKREVFNLLTSKDRCISYYFIMRLYFMLGNAKEILYLFRKDFINMGEYDQELKKYLLETLRNIDGLKQDDLLKLEKLAENL